MYYVHSIRVCLHKNIKMHSLLMTFSISFFTFSSLSDILFTRFVHGMLLHLHIPHRSIKISSILIIFQPPLLLNSFSRGSASTFSNRLRTFTFTLKLASRTFVTWGLLSLFQWKHRYCAILSKRDLAFRAKRGDRTLAKVSKDGAICREVKSESHGFAVIIGRCFNWIASLVTKNEVFGEIRGIHRLV